VSQYAAGLKLITDSGRERRTDGYLKHLGLSDIGSIRATDNLTAPVSQGAGLELLFDRPTATSYIQSIDRSLGVVWRDLNFQARNINLVALSGGIVTLPNGSITTPMIAANAVQQVLGSYSGSPSYTNAVGPWVETPMSVTVTTAGGPLRIEWSTSFFMSAAQVTVWWGWGLDGSVTIGTSMHTSVAANYNMAASGVYYWTAAAGAHRFALFTGSSGGTMTVQPGVTSSLWVTEQKR
jgi:hypothetical protein